MRLGHKVAGRGALHWRTPGLVNSSSVGGAGFSDLWLQGPQDAPASDGLLVVGVVSDTAGCGAQPVLGHIDAGPDPAVAD